MLKVVQILLFRGRRSRNKVSVGEPADGSFMRECLRPLSLLSLLGTKEREAERFVCVGELEKVIPIYSLQCVTVYFEVCMFFKNTTFTSGWLGYHIDEERS